MSFEVAMPSPNFVAAENASGFTAVNNSGRPSPQSSYATRPSETPPVHQRESWSYPPNGESNHSSDNRLSSPQSGRRRYGDVSSTDEAPRTHATSPSSSPGRNGSHVNGTESDSRYAQSQPGASRDSTWSSHLDESRMAQLLQADSGARPDEAASPSTERADAADDDGINGDPALTTTKAGLQFDSRKRKRVSRPKACFLQKAHLFFRPLQIAQRQDAPPVESERRNVMRPNLIVSNHDCPTMKCNLTSLGNNCQRGGFPCGGYTQRRDVSGTKSVLQTKYPPVPIQSRDYWEQQAPNRFELVPSVYKNCI